MYHEKWTQYFLNIFLFLNNKIHTQKKEEKNILSDLQKKWKVFLLSFHPSELELERKRRREIFFYRSYSPITLICFRERKEKSKLFVRIMDLILNRRKWMNVKRRKKKEKSERKEELKKLKEEKKKNFLQFLGKEIFSPLNYEEW